ncbi:hypothetical protein QQP08_017768 [Theobroma cacao]|nr:hypothetical protein QQP08_017768 [Theobroma cacao]
MSMPLRPSGANVSKELRHGKEKNMGDYNLASFNWSWLKHWLLPLSCCSIDTSNLQKVAKTANDLRKTLQVHFFFKLIIPNLLRDYDSLLNFVVVLSCFYFS